ncbi:MAG: hypothetical protein P8X82_16580 [Gemmatimonadales bacterium]
MQIAPEHFASRRDTIAFALCILMSIGARLAPTNVQDKVVEATRDTVLAPFLAMQHWIENERDVHLQAVEWMAVADSAQVQGLEVLTLKQENEYLRSLLGLSARISTAHVAAEVLRSGQTGEEFSSLLLAAGSNQGIEENDPVVALGGLVGHIVHVHAATPIWSRCRLEPGYSRPELELNWVVSIPGESRLELWWPWQIRSRAGRATTQSNQQFPSLLYRT